MAKNFKLLEKQMDTQRAARAKARSRDIIVEMLLVEIRKQEGMTQADLAKKLGIKQPSLSKLESQADIQVSTLRNLVKALGGDLELIAHLPAGDFRLCQFLE